MAKLSDTLESINRLECFGYSPTSGSIKPAHVANGWFRRVIGERYDPTLLNQTVIHWTQKGEINPSEPLLTDHPSVFDPFAEVSKRQIFEEFRSDLKLLISPVGGAVNNGNRQSSYNITCSQHLTEDYNDRSAGSFLYNLVMTDLGRGPSPAVQLLKDILCNPQDEVSTLTLPLTASAAVIKVNEGNYPADSVFKKRAGRFTSPTINSLRQGIDNLANFEDHFGGGLDALRRLVAFGVFSIMTHMGHRYSEMVSQKAPQPILLYFAEGRRTTAYLASHYTYNCVRQDIESLYTERVKEWLVPRVGLRPNTKKCEGFIEELDFGQGAATRRTQLLETYRSYVSQMNNLDSLSEAFRETLFREQPGGTPLEFYRGLGVRAGFLRPIGNAAVRKYYTLEGVLLEAILASLLPAGEIPFLKLLDLLYERYGLITGGRKGDAKLLLDYGNGHATVQDLHLNASNFRKQLISIGWAHQFADGVLIVRVPEGF